MAFQLSEFTEKRILRNYDAKLTTKTKLDSLDLFFWYLAQNLSDIGGPKSIYAAEGTFWLLLLLHRAVYESKKKKRRLHRQTTESVTPARHLSLL